MEKRVLYRGVEIRMERGHYYGHYILSAWYKDREISVSTCDSEMFDWLDDDEVPREHEGAKARAYELIQRKYEDTIEEENSELWIPDKNGFIRIELLPEN